MFSQKGLQRHPVNEWNEREVHRWLKQKGLTKLWRHFRDNKVDGKVLLQTTNQYLGEYLLQGLYKELLSYSIQLIQPLNIIQLSLKSNTAKLYRS